MMTRSFVLSVVAASAALVVVDAAPADACTPPPCWPGAFVPGNGAQVPANVPAIVWRPLADNQSQTSPDPTNVTLTSAAGPIALTATGLQGGLFALAPATPLTPGTTYTLHDGTACTFSADFNTPDITFTATASAPLPTSLGSTTATAAARVTIPLATASGSCSVDADLAAVSLAVSLAADAQPWKDVLMFATRVDGTAWGASGSINGQADPGTSWTGRGSDRVFEVCGGGDTLSSSGLPGGQHEATFHATLANTGFADDASPISFQLACGTQTFETDAVVDGGAHNGGCLSASGGTTGFVAFGLLLGLGRRRRQRR